MSLKFFHLFFISVVMLFLIGFGVWATRRYMEQHQLEMLATGVGSFVFAAGLTVYGCWFMKKLKGVSYI